MLQHRLPATAADRLVALVLPEDRLPAVDRLAGECGHKARAFAGQDVVPAVFSGVGRAADLDERGHHVDHVAGGRFDPTAAIGRDARRPVGDQRRGDAPLVREVLVAAERRVGERRPPHAEEDPRVRPADWTALGEAQRTAFGVAAVVAQEQDQRVVEHAAVAETGHEAAHARVDALDHRGVDGHDRVEPVTVGVRERVPRGHVGRPRRERPDRIDEPHLDLPPVPLLAEPVPAGPITAAVPSDHVGRCLEREVGRPVGHVEEKRHRLPERVIHELQGPVGEHLGAVPLPHPNLGRVGGHRPAVEVDDLRGGGRLLRREGEFAELRGGGPPKAAIPRGRAVLLAEVPFADDRGVVAGLGKNLGERHAPVVQPAVGALRVRPADAVEVAHAGLVRIEAGQQRRPRRAAASGVGETRKPQAS